MIHQVSGVTYPEFVVIEDPVVKFFHKLTTSNSIECLNLSAYIYLYFFIRVKFYKKYWLLRILVEAFPVVLPIDPEVSS
jgi:hypothetical protein